MLPLEFRVRVPTVRLLRGQSARCSAQGELMADSPDPRFRQARVIALLGTIPLILGVSPMVGYGIGYLLDRWLHTGWALKLIFLGIGGVAGVREMMRLLKRARREFDEL
jgi:F0F1-type ATP synthase assembly protein I